MADQQSATARPKMEQWQILLHGLLAFFVTGGFAIAAGSRTIARGGYAPSAIFSVPYVLTLFAFATLLLLFMLKAFKRPFVFEALFSLTMLAGAWFLADIFLSPGPALLAGSFVILLRFLWKSVLAANLCLAIGVAGVAASLASSISPTSAAILLTLLAFYDIVAVYRTKHMVAMFRGFASRGAVFAFSLTPLSFRAMCKTPVAEAPRMLLGTGDVAMPVMFAVSALRVGYAPAIAVLIGAASGFALMFALFTAQAKPAPMPALPPIALGSILAYFASLFIFPS